MDPQQRLFLEGAWEAMEHAGYDPQATKDRVGVFAGMGFSSYYAQNLATNPNLLSSAGDIQVLLANDKDFLPTRVSYKLNLKGPGVTVQAACSTSLVAIHMACSSILLGESDVALAGGSRLLLPMKTGYTYEDGGTTSSDGYVRAFDEKAQGMLGGSGFGIVVLKPLKAALRDGDSIHAVIKGTAINNDGSEKVGFTAPSIEGQAKAIAQAQAMGDVHPETIGYIEAHGTGTNLGDPIEIAALTRAFRKHTDRKTYCAIGSVKTNIGHLDAAAGVTGLIKAALVLKHKEIPASLNFEKPNPHINFEESPFFVNTELP